MKENLRCTRCGAEFAKISQKINHVCRRKVQDRTNRKRTTASCSFCPHLDRHDNLQRHMKHCKNNPDNQKIGNEVGDHFEPVPVQMELGRVDPKTLPKPHCTPKTYVFHN